MTYPSKFDYNRTFVLVKDGAHHGCMSILGHPPLGPPIFADWNIPKPSCLKLSENGGMSEGQGGKKLFAPNLTYTFLTACLHFSNQLGYTLTRR